MPTKISWSQETLNAITGCGSDRLSPACQNCYARRMSQRLAGRCGYPQEEPFRWTFHPAELDKLRRWRKPRMIFLSSMGDLFYYGAGGAVTLQHIQTARVFEAMQCHPQHTYQLLTKRVENMAYWAERWQDWSVEAQAQDFAPRRTTSRFTL